MLCLQCNSYYCHSEIVNSEFSWLWRPLTRATVKKNKTECQFCFFLFVFCLFSVICSVFFTVSLLFSSRAPHQSVFPPHLHCTSFAFKFFVLCLFTGGIFWLTAILYVYLNLTFLLPTKHLYPSIQFIQILREVVIQIGLFYSQAMDYVCGCSHAFNIYYSVAFPSHKHVIHFVNALGLI